jgi:hypothetical protein
MHIYGSNNFNKNKLYLPRIIKMQRLNVMTRPERQISNSRFLAEIANITMLGINTSVMKIKYREVTMFHV